MSLLGNRSRLTGLTQEITTLWRETKSSWHDSKSEEFERRYMDELFSSVNAACAAIEQLDKTLAKLRKDCA